MSKYKTINGWTKATMLAVIEARPFDRASMLSGSFSCAYLAPNGNKCGVGLFIPDGHPAQQEECTVGLLIRRHGDLPSVMPLDLAGLQELQYIHDNEAIMPRVAQFKGNAKAAMLHFVETEVYDG